MWYISTNRITNGIFLLVLLVDIACMHAMFLYGAMRLYIISLYTKHTYKSIYKLTHFYVHIYQYMCNSWWNVKKKKFSSWWRRWRRKDLPRDIRWPNSALLSMQWPLFCYFRVFLSHYLLQTQTRSYIVLQFFTLMDLISFDTIISGDCKVNTPHEPRACGPLVYSSE